MKEPGDIIEVMNPFDGSALGSVRRSSPTDIHDTVVRAATAFKRNRSAAIDRYEILFKVSKLLEARRDAFATAVCRETGKPIRECRVEVDRTCTTLLWSAQESLRIEGLVQPCDVTSQRVRRNAHIHRVPLGVVAAITPFNFPLNIPAHKIGPALAAGNAVILKPSPKAPLATASFVDLFHEAGLADDLLQVVHGDAEVVEQLARENVQAVTFTGSSRVGPQIAAWAAGKKMTMELGGNDPVVVMDDADLDAAAGAILAHRFGSSGQRCTSCKRAILHEAVYEAMKERLLEGVSRLVMGDPMSEKTDLGPLIDEPAAIKVMEKVEAARAQGAKVLCGGSRKDAFVAPTLVEGITPKDPLFQEETFGPVLPIVPFSDLDEAVALVNGTPFGLQAGIFSNRMDVIQEAFARFDVGTLVVNDGPALRIEPIPFGGVKSSGMGSEGIRYAIHEFTRYKTLVL